MYVGDFTDTQVRSARRQYVGEIDNSVIEAAITAVETLHGVRFAAPVLDSSGNMTDQVIVYFSMFFPFHRKRSAEVAAYAMDQAVYPNARVEIVATHGGFPLIGAQKWAIFQLVES